MKWKPKFVPFLLLILAILLIGIGGTFFYLSSPVDSKDTKEIEVVIPSGSSTTQIGKILKENHIIRSENMFKLVVKVQKVSSLKASTYLFKKSMNLQEVIASLEKGSTYNPNQIQLTFKEGERITDYAKVIANGTNHTYEEVIALMKDTTYLQTLIAKYWFLTDSILNPNIYYPLEGYLAPETHFFDSKDVSIESIIDTLLKQTEKNLFPYKDLMSKDVHYYMTMASIAELEGTTTENRKMIVGIFENRLSSSMNMGSDVTTYYGLQKDMKRDLTTEEFASVNAYNTRSTTMIGKMPVGPICNPSVSSIEASVSPTKNDYFFFVADKHGKIYYTKTNQEHNQKVQEIKAAGNWIW